MTDRRTSKRRVMCAECRRKAKPVDPCPPFVLDKAVPDPARRSAVDLVWVCKQGHLTATFKGESK